MKGRLPAEAFQHVVGALRDVGSATGSDTYEGWERWARLGRGVQVRGQAQQFVGLLVRQTLDEQAQLLLAGHNIMVRPGGFNRAPLAPRADARRNG